MSVDWPCYSDCSPH
uniref:Uncharacterized protein n=1 Tax=Anguilla anguilla TaxID=7936 RepID=A0A0E9PME2_ANGAN